MRRTDTHSLTKQHRENVIRRRLRNCIVKKCGSVHTPYRYYASSRTPTTQSLTAMPKHDAYKEEASTAIKRMKEKLKKERN